VQSLDLKKNKNPKSIIKWGLAPLFPFSFPSHFVLLFTLLFFSSCRVVSLIFTLLLSSLHRVVALLLMLLLSFSHCYYSPFHTVALFFMLLLSSLCYYCCPLCNVVFLIMLLLSSSCSWFFSSHCLILLFTLFFSSLITLIFQVQGSSHYYSPLHAALLSSSCYYCWCVVIHWRILYYPHAFLLVRIGSG
jgi:hypothetical protein